MEEGEHLREHCLRLRTFCTSVMQARYENDEVRIWGARGGDGCLPGRYEPVLCRGCSTLLGDLTDVFHNIS